MAIAPNANAPAGHTGETPSEGRGWDVTVFPAVVPLLSGAIPNPARFLPPVMAGEPACGVPLAFSVFVAEYVECVSQEHFCFHAEKVLVSHQALFPPAPWDK